MDPAAVAAELATLLGGIDGLHKPYAYPPGSVAPPVAIVSYPERIERQQLYGNAMVRVPAWPVLLVVGKATDRTAADRIYAYTADTGDRSVAAVLEAGPYTACDTVTVTGIDFDVVTIGGVDYIAALFNLDIAASGT